MKIYSKNLCHDHSKFLVDLGTPNASSVEEALVFVKIVIDGNPESENSIKDMTAETSYNTPWTNSFLLYKHLIMMPSEDLKPCIRVMNQKANQC